MDDDDLKNEPVADWPFELAHLLRELRLLVREVGAVLREETERGGRE